MSNQQLNLDLRKRQTPIQFLYGRQGESEITVEVTITDDGKTPNLEGCKLQFNCVRPDGYFVQTSEGLGSENSFTYKLPLAATQSYGTIRAAYFAIVKDDDPTFNDSTETFVIVLEKAAAFDAEPGNYSDRLNDFVAEANELLDTLTTQQQGQKAEFDSALQKMKDDIEQATQNVEETVREIFDENEATRQSTFETNEKARSEAETEREAAEALREKNTKKAVTDAKNAVTQAKKATTAATESAEKADAAATKVEDAVNAANQAAESITSTVTDIETAEAERVEAEKGRVASEETRETNEAQRVADHQKHNEQQEANNQAQTANDAAQAQNDLAQQRNNAQQAANNEAAYNHQFVTLTDGQFDPDTRKPTLEEPMSGPVYRVPKEHPTETDKYDEWYWSVTTEGEGEWEAWTATQVAEAPAIPTDKIDRIIAGEEVSGDEVVKSTSLSYYDKARKVANDSLYAAKEATESALKDKVGQTAFDEFKQAQETKDSSQDKAIENAKTDAVSEAGQAASQALKEAVDKQSSKDSEQDSAIKEAKDAADAAAKRIPPLVTTETAGIVPPIPSDAADTQYAITIDEEGNAQWVEVEATGGGAADPRELRATIAEATRIHDTAHIDVQDDPTLHTWQNTQEAIEALQVAIDAAKKVSDGYGTEYFLQSEFNDANKALLQALEVFKSTGTEAVPNLDEFNSLKARVQKVDGETSVSANGKDITFGEKYVLTQERTTAAAAVNTANSTIQSATKQTEIDTACDTLEAAVILYESQVKTAQAHNTGIDKALGDAEAAREGVVVSVDGSELEPGSRYVTDQQTLDDLASAIETATQAKSAATNQNMLDAAVSALEAAIATFNGKVQQNLKIPQSSEELEAMSWEEIAQLSAAAAKDPTDFLFMTDAEHKLEKNVPMTGISGVTQVKARIVGVGQDVDENGNKLGLTFQLCDGLAYNQPVNMQMNSSATTSGGWETCLMRTTNLPKIEAALPAELKSLLKSIKKKTNMTNSGSTLKETTDKLFLLSYTEVFGDDQAPNSSNTPWCKGEGEWYQWYKSHNNNNDRIIKRQDGSANSWWLRSVYNTTYFGLVNGSGAWSYDSANYSLLPCAGFSV